MHELVRLVFCLSIVILWCYHIYEYKVAYLLFYLKITFFPSFVHPKTTAITWTFDRIDAQQHIVIPSSINDAKKRPNIVFILADDLGSHDLHGNHLEFTKNIRSIGEQGAIFVNAYAGHATCAPSRASLMTGRFPTRFGFEFTPVPVVMAQMLGAPRPDINHSHAQNIIHTDRFRHVPPMDEMVVPADEVFLPQALQSVGYRTFFFGKWHLGSTPGSVPSRRGFNHTLGFLMGASNYAKPDSPDIVSSKITGLEFDKLLWDKLPYAVQLNDGPKFTPDRYMTDYLAEEAAQAIMACRSVGADHSIPFFMELAFNAPHNPLAALLSDYNNPILDHIYGHRDKVYAAMILALDRAVGTVLAAVDAIGETDNTIVMFTSDNGGPDYIGLNGINHPYRGWKATMFEGGLRVPFFVKYPAKIAAGTKLSATVAHIDIFTTSLAAAGVTSDTAPHLKNVQLDGKNLLSMVNPENEPSASCSAMSSPLDRSVSCSHGGHDYLYWRSGHYRAMRIFDWKIAVADIPKKIWLFDLSIDAVEATNIGSDIDVDMLVSWTRHGCFEGQHPQLKNFTNDNWIEEVHRKLKAISAVPVTSASPILLKMQFACALLQGLHYVDSQQVPSLWPSVSETVVRVDQPSFLEGTSDGWNARRGEEFIYWPN